MGRRKIVVVENIINASFEDFCYNMEQRNGEQCWKSRVKGSLIPNYGRTVVMIERTFAFEKKQIS